MLSSLDLDAGRSPGVFSLKSYSGRLHLEAVSCLCVALPDLETWCAVSKSEVKNVLSPL